MVIIVSLITHHSSYCFTQKNKTTARRAAKKFIHSNVFCHINYYQFANDVNFARITKKRKQKSSLSFSRLPPHMVYSVCVPCLWLMSWNNVYWAERLCVCDLQENMWTKHQPGERRRTSPGCDETTIITIIIVVVVNGVRGVSKTTKGPSIRNSGVWTIKFNVTKDTSSAMVIKRQGHGTGFDDEVGEGGQ